MPFDDAVRVAGSEETLKKDQRRSTVSTWRKFGVPAHVIVALALAHAHRMIDDPRVAEDTWRVMGRFLNTPAGLVPVLQPSPAGRTFDAQGMPMPHEYEVVVQALTRVYRERETDVKAEVVWRTVTALVSIWNGVVPEPRPARRARRAGREKTGP